MANFRTLYKDGVEVSTGGGGGGGDLLASNNLSDVDNAATALSNLGGQAESSHVSIDTATAKIDMDGTDGEVAAGSVGIAEAAGNLELSSRGNVIVFIDNDGNDSSSFQVRPNVADGGSSVFTVDESGNLTVGGTVDGRDVATDGTKLDGIASGAEVNAVDSVNGATGVVVLDADDIDDAATSHRFATAAQLTKLDGIASGAEVNPDVVSQAEAEAGTATTERIWTAERVKQAIDALASGGGGGTTITFFQVEDDGSTGQLTTGSAADLAGMWGTPSLTDSDFSWNGTTGVLTVNTTGTVEFDIVVTSYNNANNRHELKIQLYKNGSTVLAETSNYASRNNTQDEGQCVIAGFKDSATATDTYRIRVYDVGVEATIGASNVAGGTWLSAKLYS